MRALLALLLGGCLATVSAGPIEPMDCWSQIAPITYCESSYVWVPGYWVIDWTGHRRWISGHYQRRPGYRDHRR